MPSPSEADSNQPAAGAADGDPKAGACPRCGVEILTVIDGVQLRHGIGGAMCELTAERDRLRQKLRECLVMAMDTAKSGEQAAAEIEAVDVDDIADFINDRICNLEVQAARSAAYDKLVDACRKLARDWATHAGVYSFTDQKRPWVEGARQLEALLPPEAPDAK